MLFCAVCMCLLSFYSSEVVSRDEVLTPFYVLFHVNNERADLALSVAMTTVSSILSIGLLPANLLLYTYLTYGVLSHDTDDDDESRHESILQALDFKSLFLTLGVVLAAILSGLLAGAHWDTPHFHVLANRFGSVSGFLLIVFSVVLSSGGDGSDAQFWNHSWSFYVLVAFPCLVGISLANVISRAVRLSPPETVAISIECCYQNTGIATSVAITMFSDKNERAEAVAVPLFYGLVEAVVIGCYCIMAWKWGWTKAPPDENLCVVLAHTYEVEDEHDDHDDDEDDKEDDEQGEQDLSMFDEDYQNEGTPEQQHRPHHDEHRRPSQQPEVLAQGFWGRFFPPILQRTLSIFSSRSEQPDSEESESGDFDSKDPYKLSLPKGNSDDLDDANRNRFVSADYTAETSLCSAMSSPTSPETAIREVDEMALQDGVIFNIQSLTIPEVSAEHAEKDSDEEDQHEAQLAPRTNDC